MPGNRYSCIYCPFLYSTVVCKKQASSRVIGRQGTFIKQLQRESGCKINTLNDTELRSGLKARVMNVCGTNNSMSKGLYLIARKIASRWEYAPEWEGGDPTLPSGQGLPTAPTAAHSLPPPDVDADSPRDSGGRRQRGQRGRGGRERGDDLDRYDRDGGRSGRSGESDRRGGGGGGSDRGSSARESGGGRYGRGGGGRDSHDGGGRDGSSKSSRGAAPPLQTTSAPWITDPQSAAAPAAPVPGPAPVGSNAAAVAAAASAEAWQRLLGQIPATARESLGFGAMPVPATAAAAADMFGQLSGRTAVASAAPPQQLQQAPQVCVPQVFVIQVIQHPPR